MSTADRFAAAIADRYRIERQLGRGGMATVFLAEDVKHRRRVAVKVLHAELSAVLGAERFLREIEVTAALQHPHILPLFDSGAAAGLLYYVMPFIDGETLRTRIDRERQLPIDDAVRIATDVAGALDYAHRNHVVHRDVKPENILLHDGAAVVADFGIALAIREAAGDEDGKRITASGLLVGTPKYMSPEQASADRSIDARTDIYSLGAVLYEMLTGNPPFTGMAPQIVLMRIVGEPVAPPSRQRPMIPPALDAVVVKSLAKLPADRYSTAGEMSVALRSAIGMNSATSSNPALSSDVFHPGGRGVLRRPWIAFAATAVVALGAGIALGRLELANRSSAPTEQRRLAIALADTSRIAFATPDVNGFAQSSLCISPDGQRIVFVGAKNGTRQLFSRRLDEFDAAPIAGTDGATSPFMSPDGRSVGFFSGGELRKVTLETGQVVPLAQMSGAYGATWADDRIIVADRGGAALVSVPAAGGTSTTLLSRATLAFTTPDLLPDGRHVLYQSRGHLLVSDLKTGDDVVLSIGGPAPLSNMPADAPVGMMPRYLASGHIVFLDRDGTLQAIPFDAGSLRFTGPAVAVAKHVRRDSELAGEYAVSRNGTLVYVDGGNAESGLLVLASAGGKLDTLPIAAGDFQGFEYSPDGKRIAAKVIAPKGTLELWVYDLEHRDSVRLASDVERMTSAVWSPDGRSLYYSVGRRFTLRTDALHAGAPDTLYRGFFSPSAFSPDGTLLAGQGAPADVGAQRVMISTVGSGRPPERLLPPGDDPQYYATFSPDGRWITYQQAIKGTNRVFAVRRPSSEPIEIAQGQEPVWSPRGDVLYYRSANQLMMMPVSPGGEHPFGTPRVFATGAFADFSGRSYALAPGGRLLVKQIAEPPRANEIRVVTHFLDRPAR